MFNRGYFPFISRALSGWWYSFLLAGFLFLVPIVRATDDRLAADLAAEGDWNGCWRECERLLIQNPDDEAARFLSAVSQIHLTNEIPKALAILGTLADSARSQDIQAKAAYELEQGEWEKRTVKKDAGLMSKPGQWGVAVYRSQVRPALGSRCGLLPSCSEYFRQASEEHGLLGLPIMADRFMREAAVLAAAERPVPVGRRTLYFDPLSDHDWWMTGENK